MMSGAQRQSLFQGLAPQESSCLLEMMTTKHQAEVVGRMAPQGMAGFVDIFSGLGPETQRALLAAIEPDPRHSLLEELPPAQKDTVMELLSHEHREAALFHSMVAWSQLELEEVGGILENGEVLAAIEGAVEKAALLGALSPEERGILLARLPLEAPSPNPN